MTTDIVASSAVEGNSLGIFLVDEQGDGPGPGQEVAAELREAAQAVTLPATIRGHPDAFDVDDLGRVRDDVGLEDEPVALAPHPHAALPDAALAAPAEALRVGLQGVDAALFKSHLSLHDH